MAKTKFFRVATSGATTDGRTITEQVVRDLAETYNPATYQARVNLEHVTSIYPDSTFGAYGDVLALKAEPVTLNVGGKDETRLGLYAEIDAMDNLMAINSRGQKLFTSIQVRPNFAGTGRAYLDGLAFTDNPASLGTEMMKFCAGAGAASPLHFRKLDAGNIITAAEPVTLEFADTPSGMPGANPSPETNAIMEALRRVFGNFTEPKAPPAAVVTPPAASTPVIDPALAAAFTGLHDVMTQFVAASAAQGARLDQIATDFAALRVESTALRTDLAAAQAETATVKTALEKVPSIGFTARPAARGGGGDMLKTDC